MKLSAFKDKEKKYLGPQTKDHNLLEQEIRLMSEFSIITSKQKWNNFLKKLRKRKCEPITIDPHYLQIPYLQIS